MVLPHILGDLAALHAVLSRCTQAAGRTMSWNQAAWLIPMLATVPFLWISGSSVSYEGMRYVIPMVFIAPIGCAMFTVERENRALRVGD